FQAPEDLEGELVNKLLQAKYLSNALGASGVRWWASRPITETSCFNALVQGGRCLNENPYEYETGPGLDVDIAGCYGESLRQMILTIGLPTGWSYPTNEVRPTLGEWLKRHEGNLVPGLWTCVVRGNLTFEQDLIFGKLVKARDIRKADRPDHADGDGD